MAKKSVEREEDRNKEVSSRQKIMNYGGCEMKFVN